MNTYKLIVAYDGTEYHGWLSQPNKPSIAGILRSSFTNVFHSPFALIGASKTDAGVHALGQVVRLQTSLRIDPDRLLFAWNNALPPTIVIRSLKMVDETFHPRQHVIQKTYYYHFFLQRPLPFVYRYGWHYIFDIDLDKLRDCLQQFCGTHDFRAFCTLDGEIKSTIRTIKHIQLKYLKQFNCYRIIVHGPSFLRHMIRRIVGAALYVARHSDISVDFLTRVMHNKNPNNVLPTAPAHGLMLRHILYKEDQ